MFIKKTWLGSLGLTVQREDYTASMFEIFSLFSSTEKLLELVHQALSDIAESRLSSAQHSECVKMWESAKDCLDARKTSASVRSVPALSDPLLTCHLQAD